MFDLDLIKPITLEQAKAAQRRLPINHIMKKAIEAKVRKLASGYQGEKTLNYFLGLLPDKKYHIFHGLRLPIGNYFFQMDALLLSPKLIIILESKNYSGTILIEKHQLTQEINNSKVIYENPIAQVNRHKILLHYLFEKYQVPSISIETLVVFTKASTEIKIATGYIEAEKKIGKVHNLLKKIEELEKYHNKDRIDQKTIGKIRRLVLNKHTPLRTDILQTFGIDKSDILTGVRCPNCSFLPMQYNRKNWICPECPCTTKDAYLEAVNDYFLLINPSITNSELREFLQLPSRRSSTYLFTLLNLPSTGSKKGRIYHQP
jgi:hypothetical protein